MKKIYSFCLVAICTMLTFQAFSQSQRLVLVEEGTNASCPPCASQNPAFDALLEENLDKVVILKYQWWYPGFDQMHNDNPDEVNQRFETYYNQSGVPHGFIDGASLINDCGAYDGAPACLAQADIDAAYAIASEFDLAVQAEVVNGVLQITGSVNATAAASGDLKLRLALTEEHITYDQVPGGSNGETDYYNVMKTFIGGTAGFDLEDAWAVGDSYTIDESMDLSSFNIYNWDKLNLVAFIQNDDNKFVHQAANDTEIEITTTYANNGAAVEITALPEAVCSGDQMMSPKFVLQNGGNDMLTSADIVYSINGGAEQTYPWTGSLSTLGTEEVTLDAYSFTAIQTNTLNITVTNPNGTTDENTADDAIEASFGLADLATQMITINIMTDYYAGECTWALKNSAGAVVIDGEYEFGTDDQFGGGGPDANLTHTYEVDLGIVSDCYTFEISDSFEDGMIYNSSGQNEGPDNFGYEILASDGVELIVGNGDYGAHIEREPFEGANIVATQDLDIATSLNVFPNPVQNEMIVDFSLLEAAQLDITIYNSLGQLVHSLGSENYSKGENNLTIDASSFASGVYFLSIRSNEKVLTQKFTVTK